MLDAVISVDELGMHKPSAEAYQLAMDEFEVGRGQVSFQSSNGWDAAAATFGFRVAWCNRLGQARERLPDEPDVEIRTLDELPAIVLPLLQHDAPIDMDQLAHVEDGPQTVIRHVR